ncbi:MAG: hypothetical protein QM683_19250 [Lacrimispora sp.]
MKTGESRLSSSKGIGDGLLDRIAAETGCMYLSDLRGCAYRKRCRLVISRIPASDYPVNVWAEAMDYMIGTEEDFKTANEAKQRLLEYL